jgi:hypothetical protein
MGAKYLLSRGPLTSHKLATDAWEFFKGTNPEMVAEFKRVMPFSEGGESAYGTLHEIMTREPGLGKAIDQTIKAIGLLNKGSSKVVFKWADPAMRYSLYKHYRLGEGLSEQAAANHVWIDLVRYGTRSDLVDLWKSIPMNFFVPWRIGTWTTLLKQSINHPVRTAFVVGGVDYLREMRYRKTGRWTHLPWDYVEGPVSLALHGDLGNLKKEAIATAFFGPGGGATWRNIKQIGEDLFANPSMIPTDVTKTLWGITQWSDAKKEFEAYIKDRQPSHLVNALLGAVVAERSALNYKPERIQSLTPESLPGMGKSERVQAAEDIQAERKTKADKRAKTMREKPRKTIEDTLNERGY